MHSHPEQSCNKDAFRKGRVASHLDASHVWVWLTGLHLGLLMHPVTHSSWLSFAHFHAATSDCQIRFAHTAILELEA